MANSKITLTAGAISGVLTVALLVSVNSVSEYGARAPEPEVDGRRAAPVMVAEMPAEHSEEARAAALREHCRKEVETSDGRALARETGEETIIDLCMETAQILID
jgi:hypothetical protein